MAKFIMCQDASPEGQADNCPINLDFCSHITLESPSEGSAIVFHPINIAWIFPSQIARDVVFRQILNYLTEQGTEHENH